MQDRSVVMIGNLRSRRTAELFATARLELERRGVRVAEAHALRRGADFCAKVREAVASGAALVVVAGGDGSLTSVVGEFAGSQSVLGVLPFGTGNSFALSLGIVPDLQHALDALVDGRIARVDLGVVNGRHFANFATIGLSSAIARSTPDGLKKYLGPLAYVACGIPALLRSAAFEARIESDAESIVLRTHQLIVVSGRYYGTVPIAPEATIVDGKLTLFTTRGLSRWQVALSFAAMLFRRQTRLADAEYFSAERISIRTSRPEFLDADGERRGTTPAEFSLAPGALRVMVPIDFDGLP